MNVHDNDNEAAGVTDDENDVDEDHMMEENDLEDEDPDWLGETLEDDEDDEDEDDVDDLEDPDDPEWGPTDEDKKIEGKKCLL